LDLTVADLSDGRLREGEAGSGEEDEEGLHFSICKSVGDDEKLATTLEGECRRCCAALMASWS